MTAALYTRVSTRDKGQETANQLHELRKLCTTQGWTIVSEYEDHESGGKADRSQFKAMMTDAAYPTARSSGTLIITAAPENSR